jgi:hypothetical protein
MAVALPLRSLEMPDRRGGAGPRLGSHKISRSNPESSFIAGEFLNCGSSVEHNGLWLNDRAPRLREYDLLWIDTLST